MILNIIRWLPGPVSRLLRRRGPGGLLTVRGAVSALRSPECAGINTSTIEMQPTAPLFSGWQMTVAVPRQHPPPVVSPLCATSCARLGHRLEACAPCSAVTRDGSLRRRRRSGRISHSAPLRHPSLREPPAPTLLPLTGRRTHMLATGASRRTTPRPSGTVPATCPRLGRLARGRDGAPGACCGLPGRDRWHRSGSLLRSLQPQPRASRRCVTRVTEAAARPPQGRPASRATRPPGWRPRPLTAQTRRHRA